MDITRPQGHYRTEPDLDFYRFELLKKISLPMTVRLKLWCETPAEITQELLDLLMGRQSLQMCIILHASHVGP